MPRSSPSTFALAALVSSLAACASFAAPDTVGRIPFRAPFDVTRAGSVVDRDVFVDSVQLYDLELEFVEDRPGSGSRQALAEFLGSGRTLRVIADAAGTGHPQVLQTQTPEEADFLRSGGMLVGEEAMNRDGGSERRVKFMRDGVVVKTRVFPVPAWRLAYAPGGAGTTIPLRVIVRDDTGPAARVDAVIETQGAIGNLRAITHLPLRRGTIHVHLETMTAQAIPPGWHSQLLITCNPKIRPAEDGSAP